MNELKVVLNVDTTISSDGKSSAILHSVKTPGGLDVTDKFKAYCVTHKLDPTTQSQMESTAVEFAKSNEWWLNT